MVAQRGIEWSQHDDVKTLPAGSRSVRAACGGGVPLIPRELLFGNPEKANPRISPDGARLAYLAPDPNGVRNFWVRTVGNNDDRVVTSDPKRDISMFFWRGDNRTSFICKTWAATRISISTRPTSSRAKRRTSRPSRACAR